MSSSRAWDALVREYNLSRSMVDAIRSGENGAILNCPPVTEKAVIRRGIMHPTESNLTAKGREFLAAYNAAHCVVEQAALETQAPQVVEGVIVPHAGVTKGSLPKHADDPDARAAIAALANLKLAELTDHFEPGEDRTVRGFTVEPRGGGRVAVYWLFGGNLRDYNDKPFKVELQIAADRLHKAGWRVEPKPKSALCVMAWRPTEGTAEPVPPMSAVLVANTAASNEVLAGVDFGEDEQPAKRLTPREAMKAGFLDYRTAGTREAAEKARVQLAELARVVRAEGGRTLISKERGEEVQAALAQALEGATGLPYRDALVLVTGVRWHGFHEGWDAKKSAPTV